MWLQYIYKIFLPHDLVNRGNFHDIATPIPWLCCPLAILPQLWKYAWGHCPFGRPICDQALTFWLMCWDVASIYPQNYPASWCHLFCEVHQSLMQKSTPTTWCCHPHASWLGWCSSACKPPTFYSKHYVGHYGQTVLFLLHQTRGHFSKKYDLCPHVQLQTVVWLFMAVLEQWLLSCWAVFQVMSIKDSFYCGYRHFCTCFLQHLHKVVRCCSGIDFHSFAISRRQNASSSWAVWWLRGPMVFILAYHCLYRWTWYLQAFGNCSQGWTRLVEVYHFFLRS